MNGLALARDYWENIGRPAFQLNLPELEKRMAVGLAGEGASAWVMTMRYRGIMIGDRAFVSG